jgi:uncharacterized protein YyaL (SSP411 family)
MQTNQPLGSQVINWREWSQGAFQDSRLEQKPVLLTLSATWCHWCHVMDHTSYSDPQVIALINSRFIPIRVDVDQRPDISHRYNQGGFPSLAILNDTGELILGRVYVPPEELTKLLEQVSSLYPDTPQDDIQAPAAHSSTLPSGGADSQSAAIKVLEKLEELYDSEFGGFGREPKQPPWEGLRFMLALYSRSGDRRLRGMIVNTLESIRTGLFDLKDQGFFRYSVSRDWRVPHYEKMLVTNSSLIATYLEAYQVTRRRTFRHAAIGAIQYLMKVLYDSDRGLFYASQDASEDYYHSSWQGRESMEKPSIDRTFYTAWNALTAGTLIQACGALGMISHLNTAAQVLDILWRECWCPGQGMAHLVGGSRPPVSILEDHLHPLLSFLSLHQLTGQVDHLKKSITLLQDIQERFGAPDGGFYDLAGGASSAEGLLAREKPVLENCLLAEALLILHCLTEEDQYRQLARRTLEVFNGVVPGSSYLGPRGSRRMEEDEERLFLPAGAAWGRAWDMLAHGPVHLAVVGPSAHAKTRSLLRASHRLYAPHRVIQLLDPGLDATRIESLGFPVNGDPALYVCLGDRCLPPISTTEGLAELRTTPPWQTAVRLIQ